jgi:O-antigen/teichoic acid export membrane protein
MTTSGEVALRAAHPGVLSRPWLPRALLRSGGIVFASTLAWHASNFLFNGVTARLLGPAKYGELAATISLLYVASPLLVSLQTVASATATELTVAGHTGQLRLLARAHRVRLIAAAAAIAAVFAAGSDLGAHFLRLGSPAPIAIVGVGLGISILTHCQRGLLQGTQQFGRYATSTLVEATSKIVFAVAIVAWISGSASGAAVAVPVSASCGLLANTWLLRALPRPTDDRHERVKVTGRPISTAATFVLLAILLAADVLAAKRYLPPHDAGVYAAVSLSGKAVYFSTSALSLILFPVFSAGRARNASGRRPLVAGSALIGLVSVALALCYFAEPRLVIHALYGRSYDAAAPYLGWIAFAFGAYALVYLFATYLLARRSLAGVVALGLAVVAQLAALFVAHGSVQTIVWVQVAVLGAAAVVLGAVAFRDAT